MFTRQQIEDTWKRTIEAQIITYDRMRVLPTARDTQTQMNNLIVFIGTDMMLDMMPKMCDVFMGLLEPRIVDAAIKEEKYVKALDKLGIKQ